MLVNKNNLLNQFFTKSDQIREIKYLVLHHIGGHDAIFNKDITNVKLAIEAFCRHQVSTHYIIDVNGEVFQLVEENNIAHHAGHSHWHGEDSLNKSSIGIEFFNPDPLNKQFSKAQIKAGILLCQNIIARYNIKPINVVGHSDIAYFPDNKECKKLDIVGCLNRKDDPSHLFPWENFAKNGVGLWPHSADNTRNKKDKMLFTLGDKGSKQKNEVKKLKQSLANFGYKIANFDNMFDKQLSSVVTVFNRRFNPQLLIQNTDSWYLSSQHKLLQLLNC